MKEGEGKDQEQANGHGRTEQNDTDMQHESDKSNGSSNIAILEKIIHLDDLQESFVPGWDDSDSADPTQ